ncbi:hypothetical protein [Erythrobacter sp. 3-20A1M]|uniref:hypothetical protein n=1 Tax=Erythrobacter sp. 3-20A1M TaxID=2653850 RepID=UPI001BFC2671|nr:hypothetical protein [Erythrobacter sp. 3-20A1M]
MSSMKRSMLSPTFAATGDATMLAAAMVSAALRMLVIMSGLRPWLWYERPVRERFEGQDCCLTVEGPIYRSRDGTGYPLGSQLRTEFGWLDLTPEETNQLADDLRSGIDLALLRWFTRSDMADRQLPSRQSRNRYFDDDVAHNLILSATPPTASMEQDAHAS